MFEYAGGIDGRLGYQLRAQPDPPGSPGRRRAQPTAERHRGAEGPLGPAAPPVQRPPERAGPQRDAPPPVRALLVAPAARLLGLAVPRHRRVPRRRRPVVQVAGVVVAGGPERAAGGPRREAAAG